jgi:hypothetical protein
VIDRRGLFGQTERVTQRQDLDRDADLDAFGTRADGAGDAERRRQDRTLRIEMQFGQPHRVETPALGRIDLLERLGEGVSFGAAGKGWKLVEHAEFHAGISLLALRKSNIAKRRSRTHNNRDERGQSQSGS